MSNAIQKTEKKTSPVDAMLVRMMDSMNARAVRLENLLPPEVSVARFMESIRLALALNPDLADSAKTDPASVVLAVMEAARAGLDVHGHYGHLVKYGRECQFIPDYKGLVALAVATGVVQDMTPVLVYEADHFVPQEGETPHIEHMPFVPRKKGDKRGEIIAAYTRVLLPSGERVIKGLLYLDDIERIESGTAKNGPWGGKHRPEMVKKSSIKNGQKTLGIPATEQAERLRAAMEADDRAAVLEGSFTVAEPAVATSGVIGAKEKAKVVLQARNAEVLNGEPSEEEKAAILASELANEGQ
jgi:recombination protein RecT